MPNFTEGICSDPRSISVVFMLKRPESSFTSAESVTKYGITEQCNINSVFQLNQTVVYKSIVAECIHFKSSIRHLQTSKTHASMGMFVLY